MRMAKDEVVMTMVMLPSDALVLVAIVGVVDLFFFFFVVEVVVHVHTAW